MKKIEAIIRDEKLTEVRVGEYRVDLIPKKLLMLVVKDADCQKVTDIICEVSNSGAAGDGKIFISTIDTVIRIRTRESGETAL
jgi:nitrogen regulatory protein PII